jgi:molybdopterin synthase sulfur carrier subunit
MSVDSPGRLSDMEFGLEIGCDHPMPLVFIPTPMRDLTGGVAQVAVEGSTVGEVIDAMEVRFPGIKTRLCRDGSLAPGLHVSINDVMTQRGLSARLQPDSEVHFLPAIGGG